MQSKFWIVISEVRGPSDWPHRHNSEESAFNEAERLTRNHGGKFFVLEAKGDVERTDIQIRKYPESPFEPPF